jgi:hypothetical protein
VDSTIGGATTRTMTIDFSRSGSDGALPDGFVPWQRGVVYTVRPELLATLQSGREYHLNVTMRRRVPGGHEFTGYGDLYRRVTEIADARIAGLARRAAGRPLQTWIHAHAWWRQDAGAGTFLSASATRSIVLDGGRDAAPEGLGTPSAAALQTSGGQTRESFAASHVDGAGQLRLDEIFTEFDTGETPGATRDLTISYGEYTGSPDVAFDDYLTHAERLATFYCDALRPPAAVRQPPPIVMREWTCLETGKTTADRHMVSIHLFLRL